MPTMTTPTRKREPFQARGRFIFAGPHEYDACLGEVYDNGQPHPDEMAQVWAAAYCTMFPALAGIRNAARMAVAAGAPNALEVLTDIAEKAAGALPVPTLGDVRGTSPPPSLSPSVEEAPDPIREAEERGYQRRQAEIRAALKEAGGLLILRDGASSVEPLEAALKAVSEMEPDTFETAERCLALADKVTGALLDDERSDAADLLRDAGQAVEDAKVWASLHTVAVDVMRARVEAAEARAEEAERRAARYRSALETIARGEEEVFDEDTGGPVLVPMDSADLMQIASSALSPQAQEVTNG